MATGRGVSVIENTNGDSPVRRRECVLKCGAVEQRVVIVETSIERLYAKWDKWMWTQYAQLAGILGTLVVGIIIAVVKVKL